MGQVLHGSAKTTHAIRAAIQRSQASIKELSERYDLNPKTVGGSSAALAAHPSKKKKGGGCTEVHHRPEANVRCRGRDRHGGAGAAKQVFRG